MNELMVTAKFYLQSSALPTGRHRHHLRYKPDTESQGNVSAVPLGEIVQHFRYFLPLCDARHCQFSFVFYYCIFNYGCVLVYSARGLFFRLLGVIHKQA